MSTTTKRYEACEALSQGWLIYDNKQKRPIAFGIKGVDARRIARALNVYEILPAKGLLKL